MQTSRSKVYVNEPLPRLLGGPSTEIQRQRPKRANFLDTAGFAPGDIIGFSGDALSSDFINAVTYGIPRLSISHVGIVGRYNGRLLLFESTTDADAPCEVSGHTIAGVQAHEPHRRIAAYDGRVYHYRLTRELYADEDRRLTKTLLTFIGRHYSEIGAVRAGAIGFSFIESLLHEENLSSLFCSELVAKALNDVGLFPTGNAGRWSPNHLVRSARRLGILHRPIRLK